MRRVIFIVFAAVIVVFSLIGYFEEQHAFYGIGQHYELADEKPEITFCGEVIPFDNPRVYKRYQHELLQRTAWHPSNTWLLNRAEHWLPQIEAVLAEYDLPADLKYIPVAESLLRNAISPRGAVGFWQIMEATGQQYGLEINDEVDQRYDPVASTRAACRFFRQAYRELGSWVHVAAAYNRGIEGFKRKLEEQQKTSYFDVKLNRETTMYVYKVVAYKALLSDPDRFGYKKGQDYGKQGVRRVRVDTTIHDLRHFALQQGITYTVLQDFNPWIRYHSLTIKDPHRRGYVLEIPKNYTFEFNIDSALVNYERMNEAAYLDTVQVTIDASADSIARPVDSAFSVSELRPVKK